MSERIEADFFVTRNEDGSADVEIRYATGITRGFHISEINPEATDAEIVAMLNTPRGPLSTTTWEA